jgi:hypothetical protein
LTHLYSNIGSSFTSGKKYLVYFILHKSRPLKYIAPTITSTPLYKTGQVVFQTGLGVLFFHPSEIAQVWKPIHRALFGHLKQILPELKIFFSNFHTCRTSYEEHFIIWECGLIRFQLILKHHRLSLMVHTIQNLKL